MAASVNIPLGLTVTDLVAGFKLASQTTAEFTSQFKAKFDGLKGTTDAPTGALSSLTRQLNITKREINDLLAVGATVPTELTNKYALLKGSVDATRNAFSTPVPVGAYAALNQRLTETKTRIQDILAKGGKVTPELTAEFKQLTQQVNQVNGAFAQSPPLLSRLGIGALAGGLFTATAAFSALKQGLQISSDFERLDASLKAVSTSSLDYARTQNFLRGTSDSLGISYEALAGAYKGLKAASNGTVLEGAETERIFTAVTKAGAALKLSNDQVTGTLLALQQMMSKGTVQAEELRGQLGERLPGAFKLMAQGLGVTEIQLNKMLEQGQVLAVDALPKLATELEKTFGNQAQNNVNTMAGGFTRATDQLKLFIAEFSQSAGVDTFFAKLGNGIAEYLKGIREAQRRGEDLLSLDKARRVELASQADQLQAFRGAKLEVRVNMIADLTKQANGLRYQLANPANLSSRDEEKARINLTVTEERLRNLRRANINLLAAEGIEARKVANTRAVTAQLDIDVLRKRQSALATKIENGNLNGRDVSALKAEYASLTAQIDAATVKTTKHKVAVDSQSVSLTTNEAILKRLTRQLQENGDTANGSLSRQVALFKELVEQGKQLANMKPVDLGDKLRGITPDLGRSVSAITSVFSGGIPNLPGLANFKLGIAENILNERIRTEAELRLFKANLTQIPSFFGDLRSGLSNAGENIFNATGEKIRESVGQMASVLAQAKATLISSTVDAFAGIGEGIAKASTGLESSKQALGSILKSVIDIVANYAITVGKAMLITAIPFLTNPLTAAIGTKQLLTGGALVLAGGIAKGLAATAFANGGIVSGPTLGLVGEYAGARNNPEVIAPLDKLKTMIGGRGAQSIALSGRFELEGTTAVALIEETYRNDSALR